MQHVMWTHFWENIVPTVSWVKSQLQETFATYFWGSGYSCLWPFGKRKNVTQNQGPIGDLQYRWKSKTIKLVPMRLLILNH